MNGKHIYLVVLIVAAVFMAGCASGPETEEQEPVAQETEQQQEPAPEVAQSAPVPEPAETPEVEQAEPAPEPEIVQAEPAQESVEPSQTAMTFDGSRWRAVDVEAYRYGSPYEIPQEYLQHDVYGMLEEDSLVIEVPAVEFRITGEYTAMDDGFYRVTPTSYVNVPPAIEELADEARDRLGAELPDTYYFTVRGEGERAVVEAEGLEFFIISEWERVE